MKNNNKKQQESCYGRATLHCIVQINGGSRGGQRVRTPPEKSPNIGFLSNTVLDPLINHKAAKPVFNVGPSSARQRNII